MSDQLEQYLQATLSEGQIESNGKFTVSLTHLLEKLGSQSLYHWANYSLFAIRAFVNMGCQAIHITQSKKAVWLIGHLKEACPELNELDGLTPGQIVSGSSGLGLLTRAGASLLKQSVEQVMIARWHNSASPDVVSLNGSSTQPQLSPTLQEQGFSLGLYVHFGAEQEFCDLEGHLAYAVQYCPIPVMLHKISWSTSHQDLRTSHWLDLQPHSSAHSAAEQATVKTPLCCDFYQGSQQTASQAKQGLLLKPCGGLSNSHHTGTSNSGDFQWLKPAGSFDSYSSLGRFFQVEPNPFGLTGQLQQKLSWSVDQGGGHQIDLDLTTVRGHSILLLNDQQETDQILPILDGIAVNAIKGALQIPGLTMVVCVPPTLSFDLSDQNLVQNQAYLDWLMTLRLQAQQSMEKALEHPLPAPAATVQPPLWKTCVLTGALCFTGALIWNGPQMMDILGFTHGGLIGGSLVSSGLRIGRSLLPDSWREEDKQTFLERIRGCRDDAIRAQQMPTGIE